MAVFQYTARTRGGEKRQGSIEASDKRAAARLLEQQGLVPVALREGGGAAPAAPSGGKKGDTKAGGKGAGRKRLRLERRKGHAPKMSMREVVLFTREMSDLLGSGMTLGNALHTLTRRDSGKDADRIVKDLRDEIVQGASLSTALEKYPRIFPQLYISLVKAGEASGQMDEVLVRLCTYYEMLQATREKVVSALIYPGIVLSMGIGTMIFTMIFVVPRFSSIFEELGSTLPLPTQILIGISSVLLKYGWAIAGGLFVGITLFKRYTRTDAGRLWWDGAKLRMPIIKGIITANAFAQFARTLESLLKNGVPVLQSLSIVEETVGNKVIAREISQARDRVTDGSTISGPLGQGEVFPKLLTDMLAVGEQTGDMAGALGHIGKRFETELDRNVKIMTTVLEPILILMMAILVGFVAISMLMAVFDLTSGLNV